MVKWSASRKNHSYQKYQGIYLKEFVPTRGRTKMTEISTKRVRCYNLNSNYRDLSQTQNAWTNLAVNLIVLTKIV